MSMLMEAMSVFFARLREAGLTTHKVALSVGLDPALMSRAVSGKRGYTPFILKALSEHDLMPFSYEELLARKILDDFPPSAIQEAARLLGEGS